MPPIPTGNPLGSLQAIAPDLVTWLNKQSAASAAQLAKQAAAKTGSYGSVVDPGQAGGVSGVPIPDEPPGNPSRMIPASPMSSGGEVISAGGPLAALRGALPGLAKTLGTAAMGSQALQFGDKLGQSTYTPGQDVLAYNPVGQTIRQTLDTAEHPIDATVNVGKLAGGLIGDKLADAFGRPDYPQHPAPPLTEQQQSIVRQHNFYQQPDVKAYLARIGATPGTQDAQANDGLSSTQANSTPTAAGTRNMATPLAESSGTMSGQAGQPNTPNGTQPGPGAGQYTNAAPAAGSGPSDAEHQALLSQYQQLMGGITNPAGTFGPAVNQNAGYRAPVIQANPQSQQNLAAVTQPNGPGQGGFFQRLYRDLFTDKFDEADARARMAREQLDPKQQVMAQVAMPDVESANANTQAARMHEYETQGTSPEAAMLQQIKAGQVGAMGGSLYERAKIAAEGQAKMAQGQQKGEFGLAEQNLRNTGDMLAKNPYLLDAPTLAQTLGKNLTADQLGQLQEQLDYIKKTSGFDPTHLVTAQMLQSMLQQRGWSLPGQGQGSTPKPTAGSSANPVSTAHLNLQALGGKN